MDMRQRAQEDADVERITREANAAKDELMRLHSQLAGVGTLCSRAGRAHTSLGRVIRRLEAWQHRS